MKEREREKANKLAMDGAHKPPGPKSQCKQWPATLTTATTGGAQHTSRLFLVCLSTISVAGCTVMQQTRHLRLPELLSNKLVINCVDLSPFGQICSEGGQW